MTDPALAAPGAADGPTSFSLTYTVSAAEQVRGTRHVVFRRPQTWFFGVCLVALPLLDVGMKLWIRGQWKPNGTTLVVAGLLGVVFGAYYFEPAVRVRRLRRRFPQAEGPTTLTMDESGMSITSGLGSGRVVWALVEAIRASEEFLFVHLGATNAYMVPRRALSPAQYDAFWWVVGRWAPHLVRHSRRA